MALLLRLTLNCLAPNWQTVHLSVDSKFDDHCPRTNLEAARNQTNGLFPKTDKAIHLDSHRHRFPEYFKTASWHQV